MILAVLISLNRHHDMAERTTVVDYETHVIYMNNQVNTESITARAVRR